MNSTQLISILLAWSITCSSSTTFWLRP